MPARALVKRRGGALATPVPAVGRLLGTVVSVALALSLAAVPAAAGAPTVPADAAASLPRGDADAVEAAEEPAPTTQATTTATGWAGTATLEVGVPATRTVQLTPSEGRAIEVQAAYGSGWGTIDTITAPDGASASLTVTLPVQETPRWVKYRLVMAATEGATELTTEMWKVTYKEPTTLAEWPDGRTSGVVYGQGRGKTVVATPGRTLQLQRLNASSWTTVSSYLVGEDGKARIAIPTVWTTSDTQYRIKIATTDTTFGLNSGAWTIDALAPDMPEQPFNGGVSGATGAWGGYSNGGIPTSALCSPSWASGHYVRCDALPGLEAMNQAYRAEFGVNLSLTSTYRTYATQVALKQQLGYLAATPGTSNHGWGLAIDFGGGINSWGSAQHSWMRAHASGYGWYHPTWAQFEGSLPEAWHWEYVGAIASGSSEQTLALALELSKRQTWASAYQRRCLTDLWEITSRWDYTAASGDRRGLPKADMTKLFGASWTTSAAATDFLRRPQKQVEWGLADLTARYGSACKAVAAKRASLSNEPAVTATLTGPSTVGPGELSSVEVTYTKAGVAVPEAVLVLQKLKSGVWVDAADVAIVDGFGSRGLKPGTKTGTYRFRNYNSSAVSATFRVWID